MASIQHLQSATQIIATGSKKALTDPWLSPGEYYGSWFHYPPFPKIKLNGLEYDFIYVSHIHPDHLSEKTFEALPKKDAPVLIHKFKSSFLRRKIQSFGFEVIELAHGEKFFLGKDSYLQIFAADNCNPVLGRKFFGCGNIEGDSTDPNIDTIALFNCSGKKILNTNDCPYELAHETIEKNRLQLDIDILLVGYSGAGPYPQCFYFEDEEEKKRAATRKEIQFIEQAQNYVRLVKPRIFIPFAGTYILGGKLSERNQFRGVPSINSAAEKISSGVHDCGESIVLNQLQRLDLNDHSIDSEGCVEFELSEREYIQKISKEKYDYEVEFCKNEVISRVDNNIKKAVFRFSSKVNEIGLTSDTDIILSFGEDFGYKFSAKTPVSKVKINDYFSKNKKNYLHIDLDILFLDMLLMGPKYAHWENADIGSHITYKRQPDIFERGLHYCLGFLHV